MHPPVMMIRLSLLMFIFLRGQKVLTRCATIIVQTMKVENCDRQPQTAERISIHFQDMQYQFIRPYFIKMVIKKDKQYDNNSNCPHFIIFLEISQKAKQKMQDQSQKDQEKQVNQKIFIAKLRNLQSNIYEDIQKMANLKEIYHDTQERKFLHTFINIMDRMSNELQRANDLYQEIDKEIASNQQCMYLSKELQYFQKECIELKQNLKQKQSLLEVERAKEERMRKQMHHLESKLFLETYREMKYKTKMEEKGKRSKNLLEKTKSNRSSDMKSKSIQNRNKSTEINDVLYDDIYKKRSRSLRHATSFRTEMKVKPALFLQNQKSVNLFTSSRQN